MKKVNLSPNLGRFVSDFYSNIYSDLDEAVIFAKEISENKCFYCGLELISDDGEEVEKYVYDHFYPASDFHLFTTGNIVLSCSNCNLSKSNTNPIEFMTSEKDKYMRTFTNEVYENKIKKMIEIYTNNFPDFKKLLNSSKEEKINFINNKVYPLFNEYLLGESIVNHIKGKYSNVLTDIEGTKNSSLTQQKQKILKSILDWNEKNNLKVLNMDNILDYQLFAEKYLKEVSNSEKDIQGLKDLFIYIFPQEEAYSEFIISNQDKTHLPIITLRNFLIDNKVITKNLKDKTHIRKLHRIYETTGSFELLLKLLKNTEYSNKQVEKYYFGALERYKDIYKI